MLPFFDHLKTRYRLFAVDLGSISLSSWRESQVAQLGLCAALGMLVAAATIFAHDLVNLSREWLFALPRNTRLSETARLDKKLILLVPVSGGVALSLFRLAERRWRAYEVVDPIEANAVHGGRLSLKDSFRLMVSALISNAGGLSLGMEAAYTQLGSGIFSKAGQKLNLRREDLRVFVAAGSSAAIAAAFNAPLAGAFYGFELILGIYTVRALPHVAIASLSSVVFMRLLSSQPPLFFLPLSNIEIPLWHYILFIAMGILAAQIGIVTMRAVTYSENFCKKFRIPDWARPALGGGIVGGIAILFPQVLGSGQGAINSHLHTDWPFFLVLALMAAKMAASAISIGFGFRGGLFSAALLIGCLFGQTAGAVAQIFFPEHSAEIPCFMLVGMGAVGASIVGAPLTIMLLVLEMTESFSATTPVLAAVLISTIITRHSFGYSFSTWRFHVRGLRIAGAFDVGWVRDMKVGQLMNQTFKTSSAALPVSQLRVDLPPSETKRVFLVDDWGRYQGMIDAGLLHNPDLGEEEMKKEVLEIAHRRDYFLLPDQNIKEALDLFAQWEVEELPVLAGAQDTRILGSLSEAYVLKRYAQELEARNPAQSGQPSVTD